LEIIETEIEEIEAFLYTTDSDNKYLTVSKNLCKSRVKEIEEEAKDKVAYIWTKKD